MSLNESKLFEASMKSKGILDLDFVQYHELSNKYLIQNGLSGEDFRTALDASHVVNVAWMMWQEKAKAQAVPDTHVVVPKEPNDEIIASMKLTWWESDCAHIMKTSVAKSIYAGILKASESGAEG